MMGHLNELRKRVMICAAALVAGVVVAFIFRVEILDALREAGGNPQLYSSKLGGGAEVAMKLSLYSGIVVALPVFVYQMIRFLSPALTRQQSRMLIAVIPAIFLSFVAGVAFAYFVVVPPVVKFLIDFSEGMGLTPIVDAQSYIGTITALMLWMGLGFELPIVMYFLTFFGITSPKAYTGFRRAWIVIAVVLGAVITPTFDPINQSLVAGPFIVLYEIGIILSRFAYRGKKAKAGEFASQAQ